MRFAPRLNKVKEHLSCSNQYTMSKKINYSHRILIVSQTGYFCIIPMQSGCIWQRLRRNNSVNNRSYAKSFIYDESCTLEASLCSILIKLMSPRFAPRFSKFYNDIAHPYLNSNPNSIEYSLRIDDLRNMRMIVCCLFITMLMR